MKSYINSEFVTLRTQFVTHENNKENQCSSVFEVLCYAVTLLYRNIKLIYIYIYNMSIINRVTNKSVKNA